MHKGKEFPILFVIIAELLESNMFIFFKQEKQANDGKREGSVLAKSWQWTKVAT